MDLELFVSRCKSQTNQSCVDLDILIAIYVHNCQAAWCVEMSRLKSFKNNDKILHFLNIKYNGCRFISKATYLKL